MTLTAADAKKLTVPRLKEELVKRGLDSTGNKPDLLARLTESIEQAAEDLILGDASAHALLNEDILNDDILDAPSIDGDHANSLLGVSTNESVDEEPKETAEGEEPKEVVLADKPADVETVEKDKRARAIRFGLPVTAESLGSDNAKAARAKRFGLPDDAKRLASDDAKAKRAERFGITPAASGAQDEKLAARAARFGLPVGGAAATGGGDKAAKLAARAKRFGGGVEDAEMDEKKKARLERFRI
uniref:SAP domain-containing protein n=1 Tax=Caenorhabditis tropicalis TaxID=1561998 RepID=A0A1I7UYN3_9PELO